MTKPVPIAVLAALALQAFAWTPPPASDEAAWRDAPLGIAVTGCSWTVRGIRVTWAADVPGPYCAAVYLPRELALRRRRPVREIVTDGCAAFIPGSFQAATVFVQVTTAADTNRTALTDAEWEAHAAAVRSARPYVNADPAKSCETDTTPRLSLVSDCTWVGFVKSDDPNPTFEFAVEGPGGPFGFSLSVPGGDVSAGTGWRLVFFEDTGAVLAQRAYSARTNASDEVIVPCGFRSLSAHGGWRYAADWEGVRYFQADTNSVPDVIGGGAR